MQKNMTKVILFATFFCFSGLNSANVTKAANPTSVVNSGMKIGVVDTQAIMKSSVGIAAQAEFEKVRNELFAGVAAIEAQIEKATKALQNKSKVTEQEALEKDIEALQELQAKKELAIKNADEKMKRTQQSVMMNLAKLIQDAAEEVRKELGLDVILEKGTTLASAPSADVTDKVMAKAEQANTKAKPQTTKAQASAAKK